MSSALVALVTAGTAGLGEAAALLFARNGMRVVVNYNSNSERAAGVVEQLKAESTLPDHSGNFMAVQADMGDRQDLTRLVKETAEAMGRLDVVFSNHGWTHFRNIRDLDDNVFEEDWDRCFNMNVKSHLFLMHAAKEHLEKTEGAFISTASVAGVKSGGSSLAYSVTKAAQIHLIKGLALAAGPKVRVNTVSPGLMLTEWGRKFPVETQERIQQASPLKRIVTVEEVAEQVLCFVKSKGVTGANAILDTGATL